MKRMVLAALVVTAVVGAVMCGGTTGNEDLPAVMTPHPPTVDASVDATADATLDTPPDAAFFDVDIVYADRVVPDVAAPVLMTGDAAAAYPWPNCPPWVPVRFNGALATLNTAYTFVPALYDEAGTPIVDDAGRAVTDPDGSACATYPWLGSTGADKCLVNTGTIWGSSSFFSPLPPCNWCVDAGVTRQGPLSGHPRYDVCLQLYECMVRTGCEEKGEGYCLCGSDSFSCDGGGPCAAEELSALESLSDPGSIAQAVTNYTSLDPQEPFFCGAALNYVALIAGNDQCFGDAGQ